MTDLETSGLQGSGDQHGKPTVGWRCGAGVLSPQAAESRVHPRHERGATEPRRQVKRGNPPHSRRQSAQILCWWPQESLRRLPAFQKPKQESGWEFHHVAGAVRVLGVSTP